MRILRTGSGRPLVLIHGWASNGRVFDGAAAAFEEDHDCLVLDLPGHGPAADRWDVGLDDLVDAVGEVVGGCEEPPRIIGWAMGAMIGLEVAAKVPVRSLVCVGTASGGGEEAASGFAKMAEVMARDWPRFARSSADTIVGDRVSGEVHAFLTRMMTDTPLVVARRTILDVAARDTRLAAAAVDRPVLFVHGSEDRISPLPVGEEIAESSAHGQLIVYDGAGHAPHLEDPARFAADVRAFWEDHDDA